MKFILLILSLFVISCTNNSELKHDDQQARDTLVGVWRGAGNYQDEGDRGWREYWKMIRHKDGSYDVSYLLIHEKNKQYELTSDSGKWKFENSRYFEVDRHEQKSEFKVLSLKKDLFKYNYIQRDDNLPISETKTSDNYQLQEPPEGYTEFVYQKPNKIE